MSIVSWRIANCGTLGSILGALGDHLAPFEESGGVWIWSHFSSGFWGGAWWAQGSWVPGPVVVKVDFQAHLTAVQEGYRTN